MLDFKLREKLEEVIKNSGLLECSIIVSVNRSEVDIEELSSFLTAEDIEELLLYKGAVEE